MNIKLEEYKKKIKNKKVAVLGMGVSNTPLIKYLAGLNVDVTAFDKADAEKLQPVLEELKGLNVKYSLGPKYLENLKGFDIIFKTPVVRFDIPELVRAREEGAEVTSEMEVFVELCPAQIFAVTGSDGKTTTTTLIYEMLKREGYKCWLGGNIGYPLLSRIDEINETDKVVLELSSFQLHTMTTSPDIAVITNVSPNHLDVHKSMEEYVDAKKNIFRFQTEKNKLILNYNNDITRSMADEAKSKVVFFSRLNELDEGSFLKNDTLVYKERNEVKSLVKASDIFIRGAHNVENYLAASAAVIDYVKPETIHDVAVEFKGVPHRMEFVREVNGVSFYNDAIGTSPARTIAGLKSFDEKVILIAGGYDKKISYDEMGEVLAEKVKTLVLTGPTAAKISEALDKEIRRTGNDVEVDVIMCTTFEEAVEKAYKSAKPGDKVVLSPASASFDMFKNFEEKGNRFKQLVNEIK